MSSKHLLNGTNKQANQKGKHQWTSLSALIIKFLVIIPDYALLFSATAWMVSFLGKEMKAFHSV